MPGKRISTRATHRARDKGHHGGMRTVLITLIGPERTSDLVVDADTTLEALLRAHR
jgi:hypothetical protein